MKKGPPHRSAIMADVISRAEHATAKYRLPRCDSALLFIALFRFSHFISFYLPPLSLVPSLSSALFLARSPTLRASTALRLSFFSRSCASSTAASCADVSVAKRSETPHPRAAHKMAEFNGKTSAPFAAGVWKPMRFADSYRSHYALVVPSRDVNKSCPIVMRDPRIAGVSVRRRKRTRANREESWSVLIKISRH